MNWYLKVLKNYAVFSGRARRKELWMFVLFSVGISVIFAILDAILNAILGIAFLGSLYGLAVLIPSIAVTIRRLHDTNRSGWWILMWLIPWLLVWLIPLVGVILMLIGAVIMLIFNVQEGTRGANRFGNDPKTEPDPI